VDPLFLRASDCVPSTFAEPPSVALCFFFSFFFPFLPLMPRPFFLLEATELPQLPASTSFFFDGDQKAVFFLRRKIYGIVARIPSLFLFFVATPPEDSPFSEFAVPVYPIFLCRFRLQIPHLFFFSRQGPSLLLPPQRRALFFLYGENRVAAIHTRPIFP